MPKLTSTIGTGMTRRGVVEYDWARPGDVSAQVQATVAAFERTSFSRISGRLAQLAKSILDEAGLPSDPERAYVIRADGTWATLDETTDLEAERESNLLPIDQAVLRCGSEPDSPQGFAARVLRTLSLAWHELEAGHLDEAMALSFAAGELVNEAGMKDVFEKDVRVGEKVRSGGRDGNEKAYGAEAQKAARRAAYLRAYDALRAQGVGVMEAYRRVAKQFGVSARTIRRVVEQRSDRP